MTRRPAPIAVASKRRPADLDNLTNRVAAVGKRVRRWGCQALLVSNPVDIRYLTGFVGHDSWAVIWAGRRGPTVITDFRFKEQVQREAPHIQVVMRQKGLGQELAHLVDAAGVQRIALQADRVTLAARGVLAAAVGARRLVPVQDGLVQQRAVKDKTEIAAIRRALKIQQEAFRRTVQQIRPGQSEQQIAAFLEYQMRLLGADGPSFPTIVAADANASCPHAIPGTKKIKKGGVVLIDWGARWRGYCSDLTRVVAVGKMPAKIKEIYQVVRDAQMAAVDAIAPGKALQNIDKTARRVIEKAGYGDCFGHSLGHGVGLDIHEQPTLSARSKGCLRPGHVVTVEPGIYLPGVGGVRLEDDVLVTETGRRVLSDLPTDLRSTMI